MYQILLFWWFTPIMDVGANKDKQVEVEDLPPLMWRDSAAFNSGEFVRIMGRAEDKDFSGPRRLWFKLWRLTAPWFIASGVAQLFAFFTPYIQIVSVNIVLSWLEHSNSDHPSPNFVVKLAFGGLFFGPFLSACSSVVQNQLNQRVAIRARAALQQLIYRKALRMDLNAQDSKIGEIVNLMSVDTNNVLYAVSQIHLVWVVFPQFAVAVFGLNFVIGKAWLAALVVMVAVLPVYVLGFGRFQRLQVEVLKKKDARMDIISEVLHGVRIIKICAMENGFLGKVAEARAEELSVLRRLLNLLVVLITVMFTTPSLMILATFVTQTALLGRRLNASTGFTTMSLMEQFRASLTILPWVGQQLFMALASLKRMNSYLSRSEVDRKHRALPEAVAERLNAALQATATAPYFGWGATDDLAEDLEGDPTSENRLSTVAKLRRSPRGEPAIRIINGSFSWGNSSPAAAPNGDGVKDANARGAENPAADEEALRNPLLDAAEKEEEEEKSDGGEDAETSTSSQDLAPVLSDVQLQVLPGQLVCVYGVTGGGKSSLLAALLGEITRTAGTVEVHGSCAFTPQKAWSQNATIRENILFGYHEAEPYPTAEEASKYAQVIEACALVKDFEELTRGKPPGFQGDQTEIGEKGITLSGGQQQRVALARAAYADADVYLLDDPLSAVDAHVAKHLFEKCICKLLRSKTRVLVTHQVALTEKQADWVVVVADGGIVEQGPPAELKLKEGGAFREMLASLGPGASSEEHLPLSPGGRSGPRTPTSPLYDDEPSDGSDEDGGQAATGTKEGGRPLSSAAEGALVEDEERQRGALKWEVFEIYIRACGGYGSIAWVTLLAIGTPVIGLVSYLLLTQWINDMDQGENPDGSGMWWYIGATACYILNFALRFTFQFRTSLRASRVLHGAMMERVLRAPTGWFDKTPVGRILNRFSSDIQAIDRQAMGNMMTFISCVFMPLVAAFTIGSLPGFYYLYIVLFFVLVSALNTAWRYLRSARELKRLDSTVKSPLYAHFNESLNGLTTLRAFDTAAERFLLQNMAKIDNANMAELYLWAAQRWMAFRLNCLSALVSGMTGLFIYLTAGSVSPAGAGLALSFCSQFTSYMMAAISAEATMEMGFNSVERVGEYCELPQEAPPRIPENPPPPDWPSAGQIQVQGLTVRYDSSPRPVLRNLTFDVPARTSIGVVGRTGAGKSTLSLALLRILEPVAGRVLIDQVDIGKIGLDDLRSAVAVVPQDPILFTGTVRFNLDPFDMFSDAEIYAALRRVQLEDILRRSNPEGEAQGGGEGPEGAMKSSEDQAPAVERASNTPQDLLSITLTEGGGNLSVGERQLLCLARALLRSSKLLVMDEATANVDPETDAKIQQVIRQELSNATVITVAHRLGTIVFYDKIMVLKAGEIAEYDSPIELLRQGEESEFYHMCRKTGDMESLRAEAEAAEQLRLERRRG
uniref:ATP-dependent transporter ycf16 n=1 Tax=Rhizochromulina marina TaxID=1034831 RepID=A0A7S2SS28_9STRA